MDYITVLFLMTMSKKWLIAFQIFQVLGHLFMCPITKEAAILSTSVIKKPRPSIFMSVIPLTGDMKTSVLASFKPPNTPSKKQFP